MMSPPEIRKRIAHALDLGWSLPLRVKGALGDPQSVRRRLLRVEALRKLGLRLARAGAVLGTNAQLKG